MLEKKLKPHIHQYLLKITLMEIQKKTSLAWLGLWMDADSYAPYSEVLQSHRPPTP